MKEKQGRLGKESEGQEEGIRKKGECGQEMGRD